MAKRGGSAVHPGEASGHPNTAQHSACSIVGGESPALPGAKPILSCYRCAALQTPSLFSPSLIHDFSTHQEEQAIFTSFSIAPDLSISTEYGFRLAREAHSTRGRGRKTRHARQRNKALVWRRRWCFGHGALRNAPLVDVRRVIDKKTRLDFIFFLGEASWLFTAVFV